ncbi:hypothetical protein [Humibacillus xanthopallidus]|uniref:hypothetical protein n=1 Tax=Humibacillus xanthopallidus TaxID=412689 RepID=UPI0011503207|nr:hypothetical protein [Humibacillus xanthopallidus]
MASHVLCPAVFDALVVLGAAPGADAVPGLDARASQPSLPSAAPTDPRIGVVVGEMWRHCKAVVTLREGQAALGELAQLLALHRVWDHVTTMGD